MIEFAVKLGTRPWGAGKATRWPRVGETIWVPDYSPNGRYRVFFSKPVRGPRTEYMRYTDAKVHRITSSHVCADLI